MKLMCTYLDPNGARCPLTSFTEDADLGGLVESSVDMVVFSKLV